jgi:hypothetical protein
MAAIVIVGAGAAGIVAAIFASERSSVTLVERTSDGGRKILISGGGRCNILPVALEPDRFVTESRPHLLRGMLRAWPLVAQREFFERDVGIPLMLEEETRKVFPASGRARDVRDGLIELARQRGVQFQWDTSVTGLTPTSHGWSIETTRGPIHARAVVLATGGLSVPKTGSDGTGIRLAIRLGRTDVETAIDERRIHAHDFERHLLGECNRELGLAARSRPGEARVLDAGGLVHELLPAQE